MRTSPHRLLIASCLAITLVAGILAPALGQEGHNPFATPAAPQSGTWLLLDQRDLGIEGELVALSPDGQWIAGIGPDLNRFCVWNVDTGEAACDVEQQPVLADSIAWAPDSTAVAYSLNAHIQLYDSDIFIFEIESGESVNLTDDGYEGSIPLGEDIEVDELPLDVYPAWTPDGESLVFARTEWLAAQPTTELWTIARSGGQPESLHTVRDDYPLAISSPLFPLKDGSLLYSVYVNESDDPGNGIWRLDPEGEATQTLPGAMNETFPIPALVDVREDESGTIASGYSRRLATQGTVVSPIAFTLDIATGAAGFVEIDGPIGTWVTPFRWAPDGVSTIAIESRQTVRYLVITGPDGGTLDLDIHEGGRYVNSRGIDWASNDTILMPEFASGGLLLVVGQGGEPVATPVAGT